MVTSTTLDTLVILALGLGCGAFLIFVHALIQWSLRKKRPARPELPGPIVTPAEQAEPYGEAGPPEQLRPPAPGPEVALPGQPARPEMAPPSAPPTAAPSPVPQPEPRAEPAARPEPPAAAAAVPLPPKAPPRLGLALRRTRESFVARIRAVFNGAATPNEIYEGLEEALIAADVGVDTSLKLSETLRTRLRNEARAEVVREGLKREIASILTKVERPTADPGDAPLVIMVVGVNGTGKTTSVAKLAARFKSERGPVIVAAADTFRAAAIEQLEVWCKRVGDIEMIKHKPNSDPAAVAFDAVKAAVARKARTVLIDTAGRLQTKTNLMEELKKIARVIGRELPGAPHEAWLVLDATTGQNALSQAKVFDQAVKLTGVVLAKLDSTAKGGVIVGIAGQLGVPVKFVGLGEDIGDLRDFNPNEFVEELFSGAGEQDESARGSYAT